MSSLKVVFMFSLLCHVCTPELTFSVDYDDNGFQVNIIKQSKTVQILRHSNDSPVLYIGSGTTQFTETTGNFKVNDYLTERVGLNEFFVTTDTDDVKTISMFLVRNIRLYWKYAWTLTIKITCSSRLITPVKM